jgi:diguanylate cyclase (GGDEF)-like protein
MNYFKPMLTDKKRTMCQDVTPNTAESKPMMYAICWDDTGTYMVQVGIEPVRLLNELRANEVSEVVANMPSYKGMTIIVATKKGKILGATEAELQGKKTSAIGLGTAKTGRFTARVNGTLSYCSAKTSGRYRIAVVQQMTIVNEDVPRTVLIIAAYLALAGVCMGLLLKRLSERVRKEHREATTDAMTGFLNRRAYAEAEAFIQPDPDTAADMTYVYADINGLKHANDTLGHDAGDELITAAADCMRAAFGGDAKLYRVGGDEFIAAVAAPPEQAKAQVADFLARVAAWHGQINPSLSVSCGSAYRGELADTSIGALQKKAEARMYEMKRQYYEANGHANRRKNP